jgi:hypothetical protein
MHTPHTFSVASPPTLNARKMFNEKDIEPALADINAELKPNTSAIAKKWKVDRTTLTRRFEGQTAPRATYFSERRQCLITKQEDGLVD